MLQPFDMKAPPSLHCKLINFFDHQFVMLIVDEQTNLTHGHS